MCGIFGYFSRSGAGLPDQSLRAMGAAIAHRGPDDAGVVARDGMAVGNQRLSIIDVAGGHQPFVSDDGAIAVVQNGEIYNYVELARELEARGNPIRSRSDTEVLLRLYELDGLAFLPKLNGMFAFAIMDRREGALYLVRDRLGVKPLHLHDDGDRLLFASEIKSLLAAGAPRRADPEALHHYLSFNYVPPPYTMFAGISHLMPGHWLRIGRDGRRETRCWWRLEERVGAPPADEAAAADTLLDILDDATRIRLRADVRFGAFLSGGIDSSSVVGCMSRHLGSPVKAFSIGFDDPAYDESPFATAAAKRFGAEHVLERVDANMIDLWPLATWHCDQPHGDVSFMPTYRVSKLAAQHVKMVLTGDGADELFAGYSKYADFFASPAAAQESDEEFRRRYHRFSGLFPEDGRADLYSDRLASELADADSFAITAACMDRVRGMDRINQVLFLDTMLLLPGNNLVKPDRMGMAASLEARNPFMDVRMAEFAFSLPGAWKLRDRETKHVYKRAVRDLIGDELTYRRKQMFTVPIGDWLRGDLRDLSAEVLLSPRSLERGMFRPETVRSMLERHWSGAANLTRELRALMSVEIWHRAFIDRTSLAAPTFLELGIRSPTTCRASAKGSVA